jgi:Transposase DDE domain
VIFILILRKSVKSIQLVLNEFVLDSKKDFSITAGAFTKARKKLKHTAYTELNDDIIDIYYKDQNIKRLIGFRVLAFDGSKITLPYNDEVKFKFGSKPIGNHTGKDLGEYSRATFQACYDVLNHIAVKSILGHGSSYEVDLAEEMIPYLKTDDLSIFDRGYASYPFIARLIKEKRHFIIRCPKSSFTAVQSMFADNAPESLTVLIDVPDRHKHEIKKLGLSATIKIRLIRIVLSSGEIEVLVTSLLDEASFSTKIFGYLYSLRWGVETFFSKVKGRLALENFTGKSIASIFQDFWSTIFISNLETIMTEDIEEQMNTKKCSENKPQKINKAVSFNAIKKMAFEIFFNEADKDKINDKLTQLFIMNPVTVRKNRKVPRKKISDTQSLNFQKRARKHVF